MGYYFTSESVSEGHPDKIADQISDAILDELLQRDPESKVAVETLVTTGLVVLSGEVRTEAYVDVQEVARRVIKRIGYTDPRYMFEANSCGTISSIHEQSPDIFQGVQRDEGEQGAGDQGMMFGYATSETSETGDYMPLPVVLAHMFMQELAKLRREGKQMLYLRPDAKSQVTIEYDDKDHPSRVDTIVISTQHDELEEKSDTKALEQIKTDVQNILIPRVKKRLPGSLSGLFKDDYTLHVNPTGKFVIGGPHGDTGLTGRKIIVDTYGGKGAHGGGAFSGKDSSKVDRSAAYAARHIAKNMVAAGIAEEVLVQVAYAIGIAEPVGVYVHTYGKSNVNLDDGAIAQKVKELFDLRPRAIVERFGLKYPIFERTAAHGHMGRDHETDEVTLYDGNGDTTGKNKTVDFFAWEKLDYVEELKKAFGL
ncbi:MAG: methionine adenosyltransferase [Bacteroidales bacterium]|nr:methionine adenosyltransferase [Bacteroidales bacterium]MCF8333304.1 methionine adenosyltransferase [Bacteroidales bacterium]